MKTSAEILSGNHWRSEGYTQRISAKEWKQVLLDGMDSIIFHGHLRRIKAKRLGYGVVEVYKEPLEK